MNYNTTALFRPYLDIHWMARYADLAIALEQRLEDTPGTPPVGSAEEEELDAIVALRANRVYERSQGLTRSGDFRGAVHEITKALHMMGLRIPPIPAALSEGSFR